MRFVFATDDCTIRSKLEVGSLLLVFPPDEQWLAEVVVKAMQEVLKHPEVLNEIAQYIKTQHDKSEEN